MQRGPIGTGKSYEQGRRFAAAHKVGGLVFTAGMTARAADGSLVGPGDVAAQATQCAANIIDALEAAGSNASQIVKLTIYVTDIATYQPVSAALAPLYESQPASTLIEVSKLVDDQMLIEVEAVAALA